MEIRRPGQILCIILLAATLHAQSDIPTASVIFTTIDVPGAITTVVSGINSSGELVGRYCTTVGGPEHSFTYSNGVFSYFDYPGAYSTIASGVNDSGVVVGYAYLSDGSGFFGFSYDGTNFTQLKVPGESATAAEGINNAGDIVGWTGDTAGTDMVEGFELRDGTYTLIEPPPGNFKITYANSINNFGEVVGSRGTGTAAAGFDLRNGQYRTIAVPGQLGTSANGINDAGMIVGYYLGKSPTVYRAFVFMNGRYISFVYPGGKLIYALGINSLGQVAGIYDDAQGVEHGYMTAPLPLSAAK